MNPAELYSAIGRALQDQPDDLDEHAVNRWVGRAYALAETIDQGAAIELSAISGIAYLSGPRKTLQKANAVMYRLLAKAELAAPTSSQELYSGRQRVGCDERCR